MRINKFLASNAGLSRREADLAIQDERVTINDQIAKIGEIVDPTDIIKLDGQAISDSPTTLILLNKPVGYVCSRRRQGDKPTIYELLPEKYSSLKSAGRLDADTSGIIVLTNNGDLSHRLTHPSFSKYKVYQVELDKPLQPLHHQMISDFGLELADGISKFGLTRIDSGSTKWTITMTEGRNRQIRRTFSALDYNVIGLHRISFGEFEIGKLKPGEFTEVEPVIKIPQSS